MWPVPSPRSCCWLLECATGSRRDRPRRETRLPRSSSRPSALCSIPTRGSTSTTFSINGRVKIRVSAPAGSRYRSPYANPRAGYTAERHIVIYSTDAGNQELYGLETLLPEVQHTPQVGSAAREALARAFELAGTQEPQNLWHAVIFATAGAFLQSVALQEGRPEHVPYWIREGFQTFQGWSAVVSAAREHWLPVVRGEASKDEGFAALVSRFRGR